MEQEIDLNNKADSNGKWRKIIAGLLMVVFVTGGGYYGYQQGFLTKTPAKIELPEPLEAPVQLVELPSEIAGLSEDEQLEKAGISSETLAYAIYQHIIDNSRPAKYRSKAQFFQAALLSQYLKKPRQAKEKFKLLIEKYPQSEYVDDAYYYLGLINLDHNKLKEAVQNFTFLIDNYPQSNQIENAKFMATKCSALLTEMQQEKKEESFGTKSFIEEIAPQNLLSLIAFICALGSPLACLVMKVHDNEGRLVLITNYPNSPEMRRNKIIQWIVVITFFSLISTSFLINQHQKRQEFNQLIQMLQTSGIKTRK